MKGYWIFSIMFLGIVLFSITAYAQTSSIPDWVKNNAKWWSDGQIGESDYISSLQYLISQGIIEIPIKQVIATDVNIADSDRAKSIVVHFSQGDFFTEEVTIYTYSKFLHFSKTIDSNEVTATNVLQDTPVFVLESLPSKDKMIIYDLVDSYVSAGRVPISFDVDVDVVAGDGTIIQTWQYRKCNVNDYATFLEEDKDTYRFSDKDEAEIRDLLVIACAGFNLNTKN